MGDMMDGKIVGLIVVAVVVVAGIAYVLLPDGEGNGGGGIMFEGQEYTWEIPAWQRRSTTKWKQALPWDFSF